MSDSTLGILTRFDGVLAKVRAISPKARILAVSKTHPIAAIKILVEQRQHLDFGENRLTDLKAKVEAFASMPTIRWSYLGALQSHHWRALRTLPVRLCTIDSAEPMDWVASSPPEKQRGCLIQVAVESRPGRSGILLSQTESLIERYMHMPQLSIDGLMFMPLVERKPEERRTQFMEVNAFFEKMKNRFRNQCPMNTLSMGMSDDYGIALQCGATEVRIGTSIFGERA